MNIPENIDAVRPYLFTIAYNMLGDIQQAEDVVQDILEKWLNLNPAEIVQPKAYLTRMTINKSIDVLHKLKVERETYKGLWMPEPFLSEIAEEETLDYGILFLLEKLNERERAVFVLKEGFNLPYEEIAEMLQLNQGQCRQLLHRAKEKVHSPKKSNKVDAQQHQKLLEAFLIAVHEKKFTQLKEYFREEIVLYSDGGGKVGAALKPIAGVGKVIKFLAGVMGLDPESEYSAKPVILNNRIGTLIFRNGELDTIFYIEVEDNKILHLYSMRNPDKLKNSYKVK